MIDDNETLQTTEDGQADVPEIPAVKHYAVLASDGRVTQIAQTNAPGDGWVEISQTDFDRLWPAPSRYRIVDGGLIDDAPPPQPTPTVIAKIDLYKRMTDDEFNKMKTGVASQSERIQEVFRMADNFREDDQLWPLLVQMGDQLYGAERRAQLLAQVYQPTEGTAS